MKSTTNKTALSWGNSEESKRPLPVAAKVGRSFEIQRKKVIEPSLFPALDKVANKFTITFGGKRKDGVTPLDVKRVGLALRMTLYNQSYQAGHTKETTGVAGLGELYDKQKVAGETIAGQTYYYGEIDTSLADLANIAYGKKDTIAKRKTEATLNALQTGFTFVDDKGDKMTISLLWIKATLSDKATGAKRLDIVLHPLIGKDTNSNFALLEQNPFAKLKRQLTEATYEFVSLLARQRKDVPYTIYFFPLLQEIGLYHAYKKDKSRTYKQFIKTVEDAIQCSILQSYEIKNDYAGKPSKCTFYLNQDYGKVQKEIPTTKDADTPKKK